MPAELIPVRRIDLKGALSYRYVLPDGTEPRNAPPIDVSTYRTTSIYADEYKMTGATKGVSYRTNMLRRMVTTLRYLSENNPLLFEEFLTFCESTTDEAGMLASQTVTRNGVINPSNNITAENVYECYRGLIQSSVFVAGLANEGYRGSEADKGRYLFNGARAIVGSYDHPLFQAAALAQWIMAPHLGDLGILQHQDCEDGIGFIHDHMDEVYESRHTIQRLGSIDKGYLVQVLKTPFALMDGAL